MRSPSSYVLGSPCGYGLWVALAIFLFPVWAFAQGETTSAIIGQVSDETGAVVPNATVTIINRDTGLRRTARTDAAGSHSPSSSPEAIRSS